MEGIDGGIEGAVGGSEVKAQAPTPMVDESQPVPQIQVRLADGGR
jgi:hypothetical protein